MANELIKVFEEAKASDLQADVDVWLATLTAGYVISDIEISQAGSSLGSKNVVIAVTYIDGT